MTTKFTKGKWVIKQTAPLNCAWTFDFNKMDIGFSISNEEFDANKHLIAAAPEMYGKIEDTIVDLTKVVDQLILTGNDDAWSITKLSETMAELNFELAKARGENN